MKDSVYVAQTRFNQILVFSIEGQNLTQNRIHQFILRYRKVQNDLNPFFHKPFYVFFLEKQKGG